MEDFLALLGDVDLTPIALALVLGGLIGFEREVHGRPAGLRTHMLVCLSSTMLVYAARHVDAGVQAGTVVFDPQRLSGGIVTGVGFLGAAAVVRSGDIVRGITTGACVWSVAGLGVVIGQGAYGLAIAATTGILVVLVFLDWTTGGLSSVIYRQIRARGEAPSLPAAANSIREELKRRKVRVQEVSGEWAREGQPFQLTFHVRCRTSIDVPTLLESLARVESVTEVEWVAPAGGED